MQDVRFKMAGSLHEVEDKMHLRWFMKRWKVDCSSHMTVFIECTWLAPDVDEVMINSDELSTDFREVLAADKSQQVYLRKKSGSLFSGLVVFLCLVLAWVDIFLCLRWNHECCPTHPIGGRIVSEMNVPGLTREQVAIHLQKYRKILEKPC